VIRLVTCGGMPSRGNAGPRFRLAHPVARDVENEPSAVRARQERLEAAQLLPFTAAAEFSRD
jgi:hypothetical protein